MPLRDPVPGGVIKLSAGDMISGDVWVLFAKIFSLARVPTLPSALAGSHRPAAGVLADSDGDAT
jgi:hypothetical protein